MSRPHVFTLRARTSRPHVFILGARTSRPHVFILGARTSRPHMEFTLSRITIGALRRQKKSIHHTPTPSGRRKRLHADETSAFPGRKYKLSSCRKIKFLTRFNNKYIVNNDKEKP